MCSLGIVKKEGPALATALRDKVFQLRHRRKGIERVSIALALFCRGESKRAFPLSEKQERPLWPRNIDMNMP
jgi:hypothetical protein